MNIPKDQWININELQRTEMPRKSEPKVDVEVSKIVGRKILTTDQRLLRWVGEKSRTADPEKPMRLLHSEENRKELRELLNP